MVIPATQLRVGMVIMYNNDLYRVTNVVHITPGNWRGMVQTKLRSIRTGNSTENRFRSEDKVERVTLEQHDMEFLYQSDDQYYFMNTENYEQMALDAETLGDATQYLIPNFRLMVEFYETQPVAVELPKTVDMKVVDTAPGIAESVLHFTQAAQEALIVLRDEPASLTDAYAMIKVLSREHGLGRFRVVVNMLRAGEHGGGIFRRLQRVADRYLDVQLDYVGDVPEDACLARAVRAQRTVVEAYPGSAASRAFKKLAVAADNWPMPPSPSGRLQFFLERSLPRAATRLRVVQ